MYTDAFCVCTRDIRMVLESSAACFLRLANGGGEGSEGEEHDEETIELGRTHFRRRSVWVRTLASSC